MLNEREARINAMIEKVKEMHGETEAEGLRALASRVLKDGKALTEEEVAQLKKAAGIRVTIGEVIDELWNASMQITREKDAALDAKLNPEPEREEEPEVTMEELEKARAEVLRHHAHPAYMTRYMELRARYERQQLAKMEAQNDTKKDTTRANITKEDVEHARERAKSGNSRDIARYMMLRHQMEASERDDD